jgi:hypothetical protein
MVHLLVLYIAVVLEDSELVRPDISTALELFLPETRIKFQIHVSGVVENLCPERTTGTRIGIMSVCPLNGCNEP